MRPLVFIFLFFSTFYFGQNQILKTDSIPLKKAEYFGFDDYAYHYYAKDNNFYKTNTEQIIKYSNVNFQNLSKIGFFGDLKAYLFYKNFNSIIILDNFFNEIQKINFPDLNVELVAFSSQNELWFYDNISQKFGLYNLINQTHKLISVNFAKVIQNYYSDFNYLFFEDENQNVQRLNRWGKIETIAKLPNYKKIHCFSKNIILEKENGKLYLFNILNQQEFEISFKEKNILKYFSKDQKISIFTGFQIINYQIK